MTRPAPVGEVEASARYLLEHLAVLEGRVRRLVADRRRNDPLPEDPFRGLYISEENLEHLLSGPRAAGGTDWGDTAQLARLEEAAAHLQAAGEPVRLLDLAQRAGLDLLDVQLLLIGLAPDLDSRFERLYGYLNDDVSRRWATVGLGLELAGASPWSAEARSRLSPGSPLVAGGLVQIEEAERPFLTRSFRVPDRVVSHLLGDDRPDSSLADLLVAVPSTPPGPLTHSLGDALRRGVALVYLRGRTGSSVPSLACGALAAAGRPALAVDLGHVPPGDLGPLARLVAREALLRGAGVVAGDVEALVGHGPHAVREMTALAGPLLLYGRLAWDPSWSRRVPLVVEVPADSTGERVGHWESNLDAPAPPGLRESDLVSQFLLDASQVQRAVTAARLQAALAGEDLSLDHLRQGARAENSSGLERLARRIHPAVGWADLVLAPHTAEGLRELSSRARQRGQVIEAWGMRPGGGRGRGITALFAGDSGTGKTMSAEVIAGELGLDLYTVNLATVVDKYVGETEKNLERIFSEADRVSAVLLFDEADALFGKRSEVKDAHDRYANIEVAYLLQRMETFDGLAILATNLRANVDEAFARRLDMVVDFPLPDVDLRAQLWDQCLGPLVPRAGDLDLLFCAKAFELSGGNIRSIAVTAAYLAAEAGRPVTMLDLMRAVQREYRKLGRLIVPSEFGPYYSMIGE